MKAVAEALSAVVMTGILIGIVGSVYLWGLPLIQKNQDISVLEASERFMNELATKIKSMAKSPGRETITINIPGIVSFDGSKFSLTVETAGTIYSTEGTIPLGENSCAPDEGVWGVNDHATLCVSSTRLDKKFETIYTLKFIQLNTEGIDSFKIELSGKPNEAGEKRIITLENAGTIPEVVGPITVLKSNIDVII
jgi:hypothetical protein